MNRIKRHPILGEENIERYVEILYNGTSLQAKEGEMIAAALLAHNISVFRYTSKEKKPRGLYCGIGRCTDCVMVVDGVPNVRTCVTPVRQGMRVETQNGTGQWMEDTLDV